MRDLGVTPGSGRSPGGGHGNPLQYCCLEHPHGQRSLTGYSPWGPKESDTTEQLSRAQKSKNKGNKNRKYQSASHTVRKYYLTKHLFQFDIFVGVCVRVCVCVCVCVCVWWVSMETVFLTLHCSQKSLQSNVVGSQSLIYNSTFQNMTLFS